MSSSLVLVMVPVPWSATAQSIAQLHEAAAQLPQETLDEVQSLADVDNDDPFETDEEYDAGVKKAVVARICKAVDFVLGPISGAPAEEDLEFMEVSGQQYAIAGGDSCGDIPNDAAKNLMILDVSGLMKGVVTETWEARLKEKYAEVDRLLAQMANDLQPVLINAECLHRAVGGTDTLDMDVCAKKAAETFNALRTTLLETLGPKAP